MSNPPIPNRLGIIAVDTGLLHGPALLLADSVPVEVVLAVGEPKVDALDMALKANRATTGNLPVGLKSLTTTLATQVNLSHIYV
jgi:hypothetical protein